MKFGKQQFGSTLEAIIYPLLLIILMWMVFWADHLTTLDFYKFGVLPKSFVGLKGVLFMPFIHAKNDIFHIVNNTIPTAILLGGVIYFYRPIALKVLLLSWVFTGFGVWVLADNVHSYHIGMSGIIYALTGFLFTSGVIRKYRPLQGISLFVVFVYGSMVWGIFPIMPHVSWQGHAMGLITGVCLAFLFRKQGPQPPKYLYEIEKELGIDPPDLEGQWRENQRIAQEQRDEEERSRNNIEIVYHYKPKGQQLDGNDQQ